MIEIDRETFLMLIIMREKLIDWIKINKITFGVFSAILPTAIYKIGYLNWLKKIYVYFGVMFLW